jgi:hypothetical protein
MRQSRIIHPTGAQMPSDPTADSEKTLLKVLGFAALGVAAVGFFDLWPMYEAAEGEPSFSV